MDSSLHDAGRFVDDECNEVLNIRKRRKGGTSHDVIPRLVHT